MNNVENETNVNVESTEDKEILAEVENIPTEGEEALRGTVMSQDMHAEMLRREQEFYQSVIKITASKVLSGEIDCIMSRENLPKNADVLAVDTDASSWTISIMIEMLDILKEEDIFDEVTGLSFLESFINLFNIRYLTWHMWKTGIMSFITKHVNNSRISKKLANTPNIKWDNFENWIRYCLVNTNPIRAEIVQRYFQNSNEE